MKKYLIFCIIIFAQQSKSFTQSYTNVRQSLGYLATVYTAVLPTDSCLFVKGVMTDSTFLAGTFFAKFSLAGELIWKKEYKDSLHDCSSWRTKIARSKSGNFVFAGYNFDFQTNPAKLKCFVLEYDAAGVLIHSNTFKSPYQSPGKDFIAPISMITLKSGGYLIGGNIDYYDPKGAFVVKLDDTLGVTWLKTLGGPYGDACMSVAEASDGTLYAGGIETTGVIGQNLINRHVITAIDSTGQEEIWRWAYPEISIPQGGSWIRDMLILPDGSIIAATSVTKEEYVNAADNFVVNNPAMIKLNPDHSVAWINEMGNGIYENDVVELSRVVAANDGDGYVAVSAKNGTAYQNTLTISGQLGLIEKVSAEGDSVWFRHLYHLTGEGDAPRHEIRDMTPAADYSGYWICGQAKKQLPDQAYQQGWLLFVDNYGCMVPNCQMVNSNQEISLSDKILIYPNPASVSTAIYHGGYAFSKGRFRILDIQGRLVQEWAAPVDDLTTMIDLEKYSSGTYFLQYVEQGEVKVSKQMVVVKK